MHHQGSLLFQSEPLCFQSSLLGVWAHILDLNFRHDSLLLLLLLVGSKRKLISLYGMFGCCRPLELLCYSFLELSLARISIIEAVDVLIRVVSRDLLRRESLRLILINRKLWLLKLVTELLKPKDFGTSRSVK